VRPSAQARNLQTAQDRRNLTPVLANWVAAEAHGPYRAGLPARVSPLRFPARGLHSRLDTAQIGSAVDGNAPPSPRESREPVAAVAACIMPPETLARDETDITLRLSIGYCNTRSDATRWASHRPPDSRQRAGGVDRGDRANPAMKRPACRGQRIGGFADRASQLGPNGLHPTSRDLRRPAENALVSRCSRATWRVPSGPSEGPVALRCTVSRKPRSTGCAPKQGRV
jgi:hypothetical protein